LSSSTSSLPGLVSPGEISPVTSRYGDKGRKIVTTFSFGDLTVNSNQDSGSRVILNKISGFIKGGQLLNSFLRNNF
jgi:hypothetical protein